MARDEAVATSDVGTFLKADVRQRLSFYEFTP